MEKDDTIAFTIRRPAPPPSSFMRCSAATDNDDQVKLGGLQQRRTSPGGDKQIHRYRHRQGGQRQHPGQLRRSRGPEHARADTGHRHHHARRPGPLHQHGRWRCDGHHRLHRHEGGRRHPPRQRPRAAGAGGLERPRGRACHTDHHTGCQRGVGQTEPGATSATMGTTCTQWWKTRPTTRASATSCLC